METLGLEGYCDSSQNGMVRGWIRHTAHPNTPVDVAIFVDGRFFSRSPASAPRQDLPDANGQPSCCGFSISLPKVLSENGVKHIEVVAAESGLPLNRGRLVLDGRTVSFGASRARNSLTDTAVASLALGRQR